MYTFIVLYLAGLYLFLVTVGEMFFKLRWSFWGTLILLVIIWTIIAFSIACLIEKHNLKSNESDHKKIQEELSNKLKQSSFNVTREIPIFLNANGLPVFSMALDFNSKNLGFLHYVSPPNIDIIPFANIIECEILEDNSTIAKDCRIKY